MSGAVTSQTDRAAFLATIRANPLDDTPRLIFADWLEEQGEPERAAFIRFQCAFPSWDSSHPRFAELLERERVFDPFKPQWQAELPQFHGVKWWLDWFHRGFIDQVTFRSVKSFRLYANPVFAAAPVTKLEVRRITDRTIRDVLASPFLHQLTSLYLNGILSDAGVEQVAACPALACLQSLCVWGGGFGDVAAEALARTTHLASLTCLSFSGHHIHDRGAMALVDSTTLSGVTDLVLHGTWGLSRAVVRRLRQRFRRLD
jgi:uncharacterized protein (TIGR02996 family)